MGVFFVSHSYNKKSFQQFPLKKEIKDKLVNNFVEIQVTKKIQLKQKPDVNSKDVKELWKSSGLVIIEVSDQTIKAGRCNGYWIKVGLRLYGGIGWISSCDIVKVTDYIDFKKPDQVKEANVLFKKIPLKSGPSGLTKTIGKLKLNEKVTLLGIAKSQDRADMDHSVLSGDGYWKYIQTTDGKKGWVFDIAIILPEDQQKLDSALHYLQEDKYLQQKGVKKVSRLYLSSFKYNKKGKEYRFSFLVHPNPACVSSNKRYKKNKCRNHTPYKEALECSNFNIKLDTKGKPLTRECYY